jgi:hypothetical protein
VCARAIVASTLLCRARLLAQAEAPALVADLSNEFTTFGELLLSNKFPVVPQTK